MSGDATMHIGELAERTGLSLRTIRHYDETGLLKPSGRSEGGFRLYTESDFDRLMLIRRMKPLGFSLEEMSELLKIIDARRAGHADGTIAASYQHFVDETVSRRAKLEQQLAMADEFLELLRQN
ncbi:MerR family transcriptional regulator [Agromyces aerolatus]|uniref:MerR family transcriptional regulator n=1 Tax=Agromyces sp. LY-1074 TaxID=3074080 RepID=UPI00286614D2|nr:MULTISPECIES: MerR family transcriptional regulator [unclassified Agromyces]MDR5699231.1 MerR family transcriptional regulator [Agromyces sp. LY-1074]MDR5705527.1 MerR family transcriptional regulator [Agromyces sp. LY-1358]